MPKRAPTAVPTWRNRVQELRYVKPSELADHPLQWREHPDFQRSALRGVLQEVGIAGALLAYESPATGLTSIDGHLRKSLDADTPWPTLILDVTDAEAALLLSTHDPLSALAEASKDQLAALLHEVQSGDAAVQQLLSQLAQEHGLFPDAPATLDQLEEQYGEEDPTAFWKTISLKVPPEIWAQYQTVMATIDGADEAARFAVLVAQAQGA
jgi:hypothetical protein